MLGGWWRERVQCKAANRLFSIRSGKPQTRTPTRPSPSDFSRNARTANRASSPLAELSSTASGWASRANDISLDSTSLHKSTWGVATLTKPDGIRTWLSSGQSDVDAARQRCVHGCLGWTLCHSQDSLQSTSKRPASPNVMIEFCKLVLSSSRAMEE